MKKRKLTREEILIFIKNNLLVVLGTIILAFGTGIFLLPFDLVTGGVSGIAIILKNILPFGIDKDIYADILMVVFFILGTIILGKEFAAKTLLSAIVYFFFLPLAYKLASNVDFFNLTTGQYKEIAIILAALFGGAFVGAGCAITFLGGGSTGGLDILAFIICKYIKRFKSSVVIFILDALTVMLGMIVIKDLVISLLGITSAFICAIVIDKLFLGSSKAFVAQIISDKYEKINKAVIDVLDRTTTIVNVIGGFSNEDKKMIIVSFNISQYQSLISIVKNIDKMAFITIARAHEINGEGWTYDTIGPKNNRKNDLK